MAKIVILDTQWRYTLRKRAESILRRSGYALKKFLGLKYDLDL